MKRFIYLIILLLNINKMYAQNTKGIVLGKTDQGTAETLPGANVYWLGTTIGSSTNAGGVFEIQNTTTYPAQLIISMVGFNADTITVAEPDETHLSVTLKNSVTLKAVNIEIKQNSTMFSNINPINTELISGKELLKAACCNLSESFTTNASVDMAFTDAVSGAKKIQMLGLDGVYTQILSENMPMLRGLSAAYGLNYIPGTWIESIRVTKGTGSVVNGYESISGQINLEFLKPAEVKERFFINLYGNEKGRAEANIHLAKKVNEKWSTLLFTHASDVSMKTDMNKDNFLDMPLTKQYNIFNRWNFHNQKNFEAQFGVKAVYEDRIGGMKNFNYKADHGTTNVYGIGIKTKAIEYFTKTGFLFPSTPYKSIGIQTSGKVQQQNMFFGLRNYQGQQQNIYFNLIYANIIGNTNHKYKMGLSYLLDDYTEKYNDSSFFRTESVPGIFGEYTYTHAENFSLVVGGRADDHNKYGVQYTPRLHLRFNPTKSTILRLSAGRGFRTALPFVENQSILASARTVEFKEQLMPEVAWNFGFSVNQTFKILGKEAFINVDVFRTDFTNQVVVDLDKDVHKIIFYNLNGKSYSTSVQTDVGFDPFEQFSIKMAYKWTEVKTTYSGKLLTKPFVPTDRVMLNMAYATYMDIWKFDFTTNWFGQTRIPNTAANPEVYRLPKRGRDYFLLNAQITKKFRKFELYVGCENILNYTQKNPIVAADDPFGKYFDAAMIYAPIDGRVTYAGFRMSIK